MTVMLMDHIQAESDVYSTYCCGTDDCTPLVAGNAALYKRKIVRKAFHTRSLAALTTINRINQTQRSLLRRKSAPENYQVHPLPAKPPKRYKHETTLSMHLPVPPKRWATPRSSAGGQVLVATTQHCTSTGCSFAVSHGVTTSTTFTSGTDQTITNTVGASVAVSAGFNLLDTIKGNVTATALYSWAKAVGTSTSTAIQNGTTVTVTNNLGQQQGTYAFVTFTPTYTCWSVVVNCGAQDSSPMSFCQPAIQGQTLEGDFTVIYTSL